MAEPAVTAVADEVEGALARLDVAAARRTYWEQDEFLCLPHWLPPALVARMVEEVERVRPQIHRNYIPRHKKGGSVSYYTLVEQAPTILALYRAPAFIAFLSALTGRALQP
ncbi:MAG TPA: 2OG-Fe(II) oxygenase, partial [Methylomirabilota bacterium]|nr:2OG-Fe(II) oxygenase [Methylomirabilota bacterium]